MHISGISFSYASDSLQTRGLTLLKEMLALNDVWSMSDFDIPVCSSNKSDGVVPLGVRQFDNVLATADILIFAVSEATAHYSAGFKNAMDWLVVKSKFNSRLGTDYAISSKPIFVVTFTPTVANEHNNGARHFAMTRHLLEKLGSDVVGMHVVNDAWRTIIPGNYNAVESIAAAITEYSSTYVKPAVTDNVEDTNSMGWIKLYNDWNDKWKT
jgi:NAD(P)H-dependent FMN reductase